MDNKTFGISLAFGLLCVYPLLAFLAGMFLPRYLKQFLNSIGSGKTLWDVATQQRHEVKPTPKEL